MIYHKIYHNMSRIIVRDTVTFEQQQKRLPPLFITRRQSFEPGINTLLVRYSARIAVCCIPEQIFIHLHILERSNLILDLDFSILGIMAAA